MIIRVGAFGSRNFIPKALKIATEMPELLITSYTYQVPEECPALVREAESFDVLFFTGPIPYYLSRKELNRKKEPAVYVKWDDYNFALALLYLQYRIKGQNKIRLSVDIPEASSVNCVLKEVGINSLDVYVKDFCNIIQGDIIEFNTEDYVNFHYKLWQEGKTDIAITTIAAIQQRLQELGMTCFRAPIPEKNVRYALKKAVSIGELNFHKGMQITVGYIFIDDSDEIKRKKAMEQLYHELVKFSERINASVQFFGPDSFIMYMTRRGLEYITNRYKELSIIPNIQDNANFSISVGFGLGLTVKEAENNAKIAIDLAKETGGNCGFIVSGEKEVIGPLNKDRKKFELKTDNIKYIGVAKKTGLGIVNLSKIQEFLKLNKYKPFSTTELATYLEVSQRNCERIVKKLLDNNYAKIVGKEQPYKIGRPRALYVVNFNETCEYERDGR